MSRRVTSRVLALIASLSLLGATLTTTPAAADSPRDIPAPEAMTKSVKQKLTEKLRDKGRKVTSSQKVRVVVMLKEQPTVASKQGERNRLSAQQKLIKAWSGKHGLKVDRQFGFLLNGFSAEMPENKMAALEAESQVASVKRERLYEPSEYAARDAMGVPAAFEKYQTDGTGTVISIIDSGIDPRHPDLRLDDCGSAKIKKVNSQADANFTCKVPNGYNYADENFVVRDTTSSQHGQHVAGIAAANGSTGAKPDFEASGRIDGAAPNAQLLAMKVFSNDPDRAESGEDSDIIAAIEDSVKMGADVINLSLGSPNGIDDYSDGVFAALEAARAQGVLAVMSAGNEGQNFSLDGGPDDLLGRFDDGTVGSPSLSGAGLSVASMENSKRVDIRGTLGEGDAKVDFIYEQATGERDDDAHPIKYVGLGRKEDFGDIDLTGAYALVQRGEITFTEKFQGAISRGAKGVVVFNHEQGGDEFIDMAGLEDVEVFGASVGHKDGMALVEALKANPDLKIRFTGETRIGANPGAGGPSDFTSWGTTPTLDFKPEIAGIGGNVYSTVGTKGYATKGGTSMAAPNVAGLSALIMEAFAQRYPNLSARERVDLVKTTLMNTAEARAGADGVPHAPRRVGAGLARVDRALETNVTATVDGSPSVALREVNGPRSFVVTLTNRGQRAVTYGIGEQQVLTETNEAGKETASVRSSETLGASSRSVTVPAGGTAKVTFTLVPDTSKSHFIEGWAKLSGANGAPDLAVPYLGFVGDWGKENIVQPPGQQWSEDVPGTTGLFGALTFLQVPMEEEGARYALSPNGDGFLDSVNPGMVLMRNASEIHYETLSADGTVQRELGHDQHVRRLTGGKIRAILGSEGSILRDGRSFDGTLWNPQKGATEPLPDGEYIYRVRARVNKDEAWQNTDLPFLVDNTAPTVNVTGVTATEVSFTATDSGSGLLDKPMVLGPDETEYPVEQLADGSWKGTFPEGLPYVTVSAADRGMNVDQRIITDQPSAMYLLIDGRLVQGDSTVVGEQATNYLRIEGAVTPDVTRVTVNGAEVPLEASTFTYLDQSYPGGDTTVTVNAYGSDGRQLHSRVVSIVQDAEPPKVQLTSGINDKGRVIVDASGAGRVTGRVTDEREGAELTLEDAKGAVPLGEDGSFEYSFTAQPDEQQLLLVASDGANLELASWDIEGRVDVDPLEDVGFEEPEITSITCMGPGTCFVTSGSDAVGDDGTVLLAGEIRDPVGAIEFIPGSRANDDGSIAPNRPISASIEGSAFSARVPMTTGINSFRMVVRDPDGNVVVDRALAVYFDIKPPKIDFTKPTLIGGTLYTNAKDVTFAGSISDDGWGHYLSVNNTTLAEFLQLNNPGANRQEFERTVSVRDGDRVLVYSKDALGNAVMSVIPVTVDQTDPRAGLTKVRAGEVVRDKRRLEAWVSDANLAGMRVTVDGEVVSERSTTLRAEQMEVEDTLVPAPEEEEAEPDLEDASGGAGTADAGGAAKANNPRKDAAKAQPVRMASGTRTTAVETRLSSTIDTSKLKAGMHTVVVEGIDLAGNQTRHTSAFFVDASAVIEGPGSLNLEVDRGALADQDTLSKKVVGSYKVVDDGSAFADGDTTLSLLEGTVLVPGTQQVVLVATDADGRIVLRSVTVTITVKDDRSGSGSSDSGGDGSGDGAGGNGGLGGDRLDPDLGSRDPGKPGSTTDEPLGDSPSGGGAAPATPSPQPSEAPRPFLPRTGGEGAGMGLVGLGLAAGLMVLGFALRTRRKGNNSKAR